MYLPQMNWSSDERADIHICSWYSTGRHSPSELAELASVNHLSVIALTDHDTVDGIPEMIAAGASHRIYVIPGVMIRSRNRRFIGYFIDYQNKGLLNFLSKIRSLRCEALKRTIHRFNRSDLSISWDELVRYAHPAMPSRFHLANMLIEMGFFQDKPSVFKFLDENRIDDPPDERPSDEMCVRIIQDAGGLVIASGQNGMLAEDVAHLSKLGVMGYMMIQANPEAKIANPLNRPDFIFLQASECHTIDPKSEIGNVTIGCNRLNEMMERLPNNCVYRSYFKRMYWRVMNLSHEEFIASLTPKEVSLTHLVRTDLLSFDPELPEMPHHFKGTPFILIGPGAFHRHHHVKEIVRELGIRILAEDIRNNYPDIAWMIYNLNQLSPACQKKELYKFSLDKYLYGSSASLACVIFIEPPSNMTLLEIKQKIRSAMGLMHFYRVSYQNHVEINFSSYVHIPNNEDINSECWKLRMLNMFHSIQSE